MVQETGLVPGACGGDGQVRKHPSFRQHRPRGRHWCGLIGVILQDTFRLPSLQPVAHIHHDRRTELDARRGETLRSAIGAQGS